MQNNTFQSNEPESVQAPEPIEAQVAERTKDLLKKTGRKISLKTAIIVAAIIAVGVLGYLFKGLFIAASVDGSLISRLEIIQKLEKTSGKSALDSIITEKLIKNEAKAKGISISEEEVSAEIKKVQAQIEAQGGKLEEALAIQGMSINDLRGRIVLQKSLEKMLADKITVSDQEVEKYITDNKVPLPPGEEAQTRSQIKESLIGQKLNTEAPILIDGLKAKAKIKYFVNY